jgi:hypothetical protein
MHTVTELLLPAEQFVASLSGSIARNITVPRSQLVLLKVGQLLRRYHPRRDFRAHLRHNGNALLRVSSASTTHDVLL